MKKIIILVVFFILSGCTHVGISNTSLLSSSEAKVSRENLRDFPLSVDAEANCFTSTAGATMNGTLMKTQCSNESRIRTLVEVFGERGVKPIPSADPASPHLTIRTEKMSDFLESTTGFFNVITLGMLPLYNYTDYTVTYKSAKDNIVISKTVRISSTTSWFSLLLSNPENLDENQIKSRAEKNLIRSVLDDANIK